MTQVPYWIWCHYQACPFVMGDLNLTQEITLLTSEWGIPQLHHVNSSAQRRKTCFTTAWSRGEWVCTRIFISQESTICDRIFYGEHFLDNSFREENRSWSSRNRAGQERGRRSENSSRGSLEGQSPFGVALCLKSSAAYASFKAFKEQDEVENTSGLQRNCVWIFSSLLCCVYNTRSLDAKWGLSWVVPTSCLPDDDSCFFLFP